ncbi:hypothetical protein [Cognatiyoonia sp. IB215182]|uniref:hypothetical protein n=1 Tax=Cognatiyoonia sp. IB215182 TaxID=3097353 RepID=UPI002A17B56F|nr:hypothetical protein [Cognatiyoonia sp. IB215182]MDX8352583.1 hypothetical protein [Cognatiyoonia sp. IB215182]
MRLPLTAVVTSFLFATTALANVTSIADLQRGQTATVAGTIDRFFDEDELRLTDDTGSVRVYLGPDLLPIQTGEQVTIEGIMDDDVFRDELYARRITRENGDVLVIDRRWE